ncbi:MAG: acyl carrier protein [Kiritimatiellae bacterium]|nr:acyl carrier protein [Kiritimatiellia bacterium]
MTKEEISEKIRGIVADQLGVNIEAVTEESNFQNDLLADVLDFYEIVMKIEDAFEIDIPDDDEEKLTTLGRAVEYITAIVAKQ